jgi:SAM-dependent methyltransferase
MVLCRQCGSGKLIHRGALPKGRRFAGQALVPELPGGVLYECAECSLAFRHPTLSKAEYLRLYQKADDNIWDPDQSRTDLRLVRETILREYRRGRVLDVGCYTGGLLASLDAGFDKFGIEPSASAAAAAERNGVKVLGAEMKDLRNQTFDVICAVDVIEHVEDPLRMLAEMAGALRPGGAILVSTGDYSARAWALCGASYWYCAFPEHVSFLSPEWARKAAASLELRVEVDRFPYRTLSSRERIRAVAETTVNAARASADALSKAIFPDSRPLSPRFSIGTPGLFVDHFLALFKSRG